MVHTCIHISFETAVAVEILVVYALESFVQGACSSQPKSSPAKNVQRSLAFSQPNNREQFSDSRESFSSMFPFSSSFAFCARVAPRLSRLKACLSRMRISLIVNAPVLFFVCFLRTCSYTVPRLSPTENLLVANLKVSPFCSPLLCAQFLGFRKRKSQSHPVLQSCKPSVLCRIWLSHNRVSFQVE